MLTKKTLAAAIAVTIAGGWVLDAEAQRSGTRIIRYSDPWRMEGYAPPTAYSTIWSFFQIGDDWYANLTVSANANVSDPAEGFLTDWQEYATDTEPCDGEEGCRFVGGVPADYTMSYLQGKLIYAEPAYDGLSVESYISDDDVPPGPPPGPFMIEWRRSFSSSGSGSLTERADFELPFIDDATPPNPSDCVSGYEVTNTCLIQMYAVTPAQLGIGSENDLLYRLTCPDGTENLATCYNQTGYTAVTRFSTEECADREEEEGPTCVGQALATGNYGVGTTFFAPEPTSLALLGLGLAGMGFAGRRRGR